MACIIGMKLKSNKQLFDKVASFLGMLMFAYFLVFSIDLTFDNQGNVKKKQETEESIDLDEIENGFIADQIDNPDHTIVHYFTSSPNLLYRLFFLSKETIQYHGFHSSIYLEINLPPPRIV